MANVTENAQTARLRQLKELPRPRGLPVIGNLLQVDLPRFHQQLEQWSRELGSMYCLDFGRRTILVVADHEKIASILRNRPDGFRRTSRMDEIGREMGIATGVFAANGEAWRRQRRMVMAGFDPAHVKSYFPSLLKVTRRLGGRWEKAARTGTTIDLQADLMRFTVDAIAGLAFGADVNTLESDEDVIQRHLDQIFPALFKRLMAAVPYWRFFKLPADRKLGRSLVEVNRAVAGFIAEARTRMQANPGLHDRPNNLLEAMIAAAAQESGRIHDDEVAGNVLTMLLAGEDTTANTLAWMIYLLVRNPETLARALSEVREVAGDPACLTLEQMAKLHYVEACAHETMRLKPVAPQLGAQALADITIGDVLVPKDTLVFCLLRHDGISESYVPDAHEFRPERWLAANESGSLANTNTSAKRLSMPFGAGPRICPGRYLALLEMKMAMALLLGKFDIVNVDTPDGLEAREHLSFTMAPVGLSMSLRERPSANPNSAN